MSTPTAVSPLAPAHFPVMPPVRGVRLAAGAAGIRYHGRDDLILADLASDTTVAGAFTRSRTAAAPVLWCRDRAVDGRARALVVNSGNANAFTGIAGAKAVERTVIAAGSVLRCPADEVFVASTGVIGQPLAVERLEAELPRLGDRLAPDAWEAAARAIMTTDTFPKGASRTVTVDGAPVVINGFAKGSGMIAPDMATLLAFVFTDANIAAPALRAMLRPAVDRSFNCVTVDGDTSTNDTLLLFATGNAGNETVVDAGDPRATAFSTGLEEVLTDLARQVARDGEGASKFVTIAVTGAESDGAARQIGLTIANSPLVKTAIAGEDANWGRIVMAVGRAGVAIDPDRLAIAIGRVPVARNGGPVAGYDEGPVTAHMRGREIDIAVDVGLGPGRATVWTCDLTHGYIDINGHYRT